MLLIGRSLFVLVVTSCLAHAVDAPAFSHQRGHYSSSFTLTITAPAGAVVRYTTDSEWPDANSAGGSASVSFAVTTTTVVKAVAIAGEDVSKTVAQSYIFPADVLAQMDRAKGLPASPPSDENMRRPDGWGNTAMGKQASIADLEALPVLSISLPTDHMFDYKGEDVEPPGLGLRRGGDDGHGVHDPAFRRRGHRSVEVE